MAAAVRGRVYELSSAVVLRAHGFVLQHAGQAGDQGVDLRGFWRLPDRSLPVIAQCKLHRRRSGPSHIRELQGSLSVEADPGTLGLLVCSAG